MWAINLRTAVRLKGAFSAMAFDKVISLRVHSGISMGEVEPSHTGVEGGVRCSWGVRLLMVVHVLSSW